MLGGMIDPVAAFGNHLPVRIRFGEGVAATLPTCSPATASSRPFLLIDRGLDGIPAIAEVVGAVTWAGRYDKAPGEPTDSQVNESADLLRASGADSIVAIGGGSVMDTAKTARLCVDHGGPVRVVGRRRPRVPAAGAAAGADPDHGRHRLRGLGRRGDHQRGDAHQGRHRVAEHARPARARRSGAHLRAAAHADARRRRRRARAGHRRDRRHRAHADRQRHRARGHSHGGRGAARRLRRRLQPRGPPADGMREPDRAGSS